MLVVAVIAIIFVGPRELPGMLRTLGRAVSKVRGLAGDFQRQMDNAIKEAELDDVKKSVESVRNLDPTKAIKDKLNPLKQDMEDAKDEIEAAAVEPPKPIKPSSNSGSNAVPGFSSKSADQAEPTAPASEIKTVAEAEEAAAEPAGKTA